MTRRNFLQSSAAPLLPQIAPAASGTPPNILLIMSDQMTPSMTGPYGQKAAHTPNLDRLAKSGSLFENAYCNSPLCVPSRISMFSGRLPAAAATYDNASEWAAHQPSFVHYLRRAGYKTAVAGKTHFIGPDQFHGFDERLTPCIFPAGFNMLPDWSLGAVYNKGTSVQEMLSKLGPSKWNRQLGFDQLTYERSIERLRHHAVTGEKQPLFLNVSFTQPHDPFTTTAEFLDLHRAEDMPLPHPFGDIRRQSPTYEWFRIHHGTDHGDQSEARIREARRNYFGMISWIDHKVGGLLDEVNRLGMAQNTVVVFTSDHGEMLGEHGQWSKRLMLEFSARIPLIVAGPGIPSGRRFQTLVSLLDFFPTFAELSRAPGGVAPETPLDGKSLLSLLDGREPEGGREVVAEYFGEGSLEPIRMVRQGSHKVITVNGYKPQLFDLEHDPNESENLSGRSEYRDAESKLLARAARDWNGPELKRLVLASQRDRATVKPFTPRWDYANGPFQL